MTFSIFEKPIILDHYSGPYGIFLQLVQKEEIEISSIPLLKLVQDFDLDPLSMDEKAEAIFTFAFCLRLKSQKLLPLTPLEPENDEELLGEPLPLFCLVDYYHAKELAKTLVKKEEKQLRSFPRPKKQIPDAIPTPGVEHLTIEDLASLFQKTLEKTSFSPEDLSQETFTVAEKIVALREILREKKRISFDNFFVSANSKEELIVFFLALLELMKLGESSVIKEDEVWILWKS